MRTGISFAICGFMAALAATQSADAQYATATRLRFGRHTNVSGPPTQAEQDSILATASSALLLDSGTDDLPCNLTLSRLGFSNIFSNGTDIVNNQADFTATLNTTSTFVNVVNEINWCSSTGSFAGCANTASRKPFLVSNSAMHTSRAGVVVAHEFGHTQGLEHDNGKPLQIMASNPTSTSTKIRADAICVLAFRTPFTATCPPNVNTTLPGVCSPSTGPFPAAALSGPLAGSDGIHTDDESESDFSDVAIEDLALTLIVDRVPLEAELYYDQDDVAVLAKMLTEPEHAPYHRTIVTLIGIISDGSSADVDVIEQYAAQKDADVSAAMMALGYLFNRTGNQTALDILSVSFFDTNERASNAAILGLILSGDSQAAEQLSEQAASAAEPRKLDALRQAVLENRRVAQLGLIEHYRQPPPSERSDRSLAKDRNVPAPVVDPLQ